jgi:hypothetical protein
LFDWGSDWIVASIASIASIQYISDNAKENSPSITLTKEPRADKALAGIGSSHKNVKLFAQLFAQVTVLLGFASNGSHEVSRHVRDCYWGEDGSQWRHELGFDDFDGDIVDESF